MGCDTGTRGFDCYNVRIGRVGRVCVELSGGCRFVTDVKVLCSCKKECYWSY